MVVGGVCVLSLVEWFCVCVCVCVSMRVCLLSTMLVPVLLVLVRSFGVAVLSCGYPWATVHPKTKAIVGPGDLNYGEGCTKIVQPGDRQRFVCKPPCIHCESRGVGKVPVTQQWTSALGEFITNCVSSESDLTCTWLYISGLDISPPLRPSLILSHSSSSEVIVFVRSMTSLSFLCRRLLSQTGLLEFAKSSTWGFTVGPHYHYIGLPIPIHEQSRNATVTMTCRPF